MYVDPSGYAKDKCNIGGKTGKDSDESATGGNRQVSQNGVDEVVQGGSTSELNYPLKDIDIDMSHYGVGRDGSWQSGPDAPHIGWQVGRKNTIVGHYLNY